MRKIDAERVIREMREAANMEHPWIPGGRADLIRDAADLLERLSARPIVAIDPGWPMGIATYPTGAVLDAPEGYDIDRYGERPSEGTAEAS